MNKDVTMFIMFSKDMNRDWFSFAEESVQQFSEKVVTIPFVEEEGHPELRSSEFPRTKFLSGILGRYLEARLVTSPWYGFIYADEFLPPELSEAIPTFTASEYDFLVLYKRVMGRALVGENISISYGFSPRLFRSHVRLSPELLPIGNLSSTSVLNGFIKEREVRR